jgi:hypothetical protein
VQIGDNRAAEWVRRSNPVALGLLFSGLAGQLVYKTRYLKKFFFISQFEFKRKNELQMFSPTTLVSSHSILVRQSI